MKIDYAKDRGVYFGDYVEVYHPKVPNNAMLPTTELCIFLYPAGSWTLLSLESKAYIRGTNFIKLATIQHVINVMN